MYYFYGKINRGQVICPLYRGCPLFGGSVIRGFTVVSNFEEFLCISLLWPIQILGSRASKNCVYNNSKPQIAFMCQR